MISTHIDEVAERLGVDAVHDGFGGACRAAGGQDEDLIEDLEGADEAEDDHIVEGRAQRRKGDVTELLPCGGAVEGSGLIQFGGDALQTCEEDDHEVAEVLPHGDEDDGGHRRFACTEQVEVRRTAEQRDPVRDETEGRGEDELPCDGGDGQGDDERQEHAGTEESDELEVLAVEQQCERECDDHDDRSVGHCVDEGVLDVGPEVLALEQRDVVLEANEFGGSACVGIDAAVGQGRDERLDGRVEDEDGEDDERA